MLKYRLIVEDAYLVGGDALVDAEVLAAQRVDGDVPLQRAHARLLQRQAVAAPPRHARPLRALRLLRLAVHLHRLAHLHATRHIVTPRLILLYCLLINSYQTNIQVVLDTGLYQ